MRWFSRKPKPEPEPDEYDWAELDAYLARLYERLQEAYYTPADWLDEDDTANFDMEDDDEN